MLAMNIDTTRLRRRLPPVLVALLVVVLATLAGYNHRLPLTIPADSTVRRAFAGLYPLEDNGTVIYRWTNGSGSICLDEGRRVARTGAHIVLLGDGAVPLGIDAVTFVVDAEPLVTAPLRPTRMHYHLLLDTTDAPPGDTTRCIGLVSDSVRIDGIVETSSGPSSERRRLGVPFADLTLERLHGPAPDLLWPDPLQLGLNLLLASMVFLMLAAAGVPAWWVAALVSLPAALMGALAWAGWMPPGLFVLRSQLPLVGGLAITIGSAVAFRLLSRRLEQAPWLPARWRTHQLLRDLLWMLFWSVVLWGGVRVTQLVYGRHGVWPLKAGVWPDFTPMILLPLGCFALWLGLVLWQLRRFDRLERTPEAAPTTRRSLGLALLTLLAGAILLPVVLKVSVRGWDLLYYTFSQNPSDYILDVPRIGNPLVFLGDYVAISPTLTWHNANHPPGAVLLLWLVAQVMGPGPVPATAFAIVASSLAGVAAFWLGLRMGGPLLALLAGAIFVAMPYHNVYSVTSMDGIFNAAIALGMVSFFLALEPGGHWRQAVLSGVLIAVALFFTYATTQLAFFGFSLLCLSAWRQGSLWHPLRQSVLSAGALVACYLLLYLATGFNVIEGALQATANNSRFIERPAFVSTIHLAAFPSLQHYVYHFWINIVPFGWYLAPWGLAALTPQFLRALEGFRAKPPAAPASDRTLLLALVGLVAGMWLSGLFIREVERIWGFVSPLAAVLIALHAWQGATRWERLWRAGLYITLFFGQAAVMRMLLNTYW